MRPAPEDLAVFVRGLEDDLLLPALWLVRRAGLGVILRSYEPERKAIELIEDRLFTEQRPLYELLRDRIQEN